MRRLVCIAISDLDLACGMFIVSLTLRLNIRRSSRGLILTPTSRVLKLSSYNLIVEVEMPTQTVILCLFTRRNECNLIEFRCSETD